MGFLEPAFLQLLPKLSFQTVPTDFLLPNRRILLLRAAKNPILLPPNKATLSWQQQNSHKFM